MEKDIEILKRIWRKLPMKDIEGRTAIVNLLSRVKELEEENRTLKQGINPSYEETISELEKQLFDSIPKSKIKEKINAYSKSCAVVDAFIVDVLQELMEEK